MKKKIMSVLLAAMISVSGAASINAYTEQELMQAQEYTKYALNETYAALNNLWAQKQELDYEISVLDQNLVQVMVSVDVLTSDIAAKEQDIALTSENLEKAKNAQAEQYEAMKQRIQYLYENGGDDAWFEMLLNGDDIGDMLTRGEYTQKMYESDRENLEKFKSTVNLHTKFLGSDYVRDVACVSEGDPRLEVTVAVVKDRPIRVALRVNGETAREETVTWSEKDVDGFTPINVGKMMIGDECFLPCTPHGIIKLIEFSGMDIRGKHAVVIGRSNIVGKPVAALLARKETNATVTLCHTGTPDVGHFTRDADIVVVAAGRPNTLTGDMLKPGAVVIDVGVNRIPDATKPKGFRLVGDADFESCSKVAGAITPVPGGVGPMTITMLLWNTLESARRAM